jgi:hypothetical protein
MGVKNHASHQIPSKNALHEHEKSIFYPIMPFRDGFRATLPEVLCKTITRLFLSPELAEALAKLKTCAFPLKISCLTGLDGSGRQQKAHQISQNGITQGNRLTVVTCLQTIKTQQDILLYKSPYR